MAKEQENLFNLENLAFSSTKRKSKSQHKETQENILRRMAVSADVLEDDLKKLGKEKTMIPYLNYCSGIKLKELRDSLSL